MNTEERCGSQRSRVCTIIKLSREKVSKSLVVNSLVRAHKRTYGSWVTTVKGISCQAIRKAPQTNMKPGEHSRSIVLQCPCVRKSGHSS